MTVKAYSYIRFSSPEQLKGDSLRRQLEASKRYAEENGLTLDESIDLKDYGVSAYRGEHKTKGALGIFLNLIGQGKIEKGSILIIEAFDRLSREKVLDAFDGFSEIVKAGIQIVTLNNGQVYTEKNISENFGLLLMSLFEMSSAHGESERKSQRLKESWKNKRANIEKRKLTARAPEWLQLNKDKTEFKVFEDRAKVIKQIFEMKKDLNGIGSISKTLNETSGIWKPKNGWRRSYINKILRNDSVIGNFQPHKKIDGKRQPTGEPIENYYPGIIDKSLFYEIQEQIKKNRHFGGKTGTISNLFGHIAFCEYCGAPMRLENKGNSSRSGGKSFICDNARRGRGCHKYRLKYEPLENLILEFCKGLDVSDILGKDDKKKAELETLKSTYITISHELETAKTDIKNLLDRLQKTTIDSVSVHIENRIQEIDEKKKQLASDKTELEKKIEVLESASQNIEMEIASVKELIEIMKDVEEDKRIDIRKKLRDRIRNLIHRIDIAPAGLPLMTEDRLSEIIEELYLHQNWTFERIEKRLPEWEQRIDNTDYQTVRIQFKTGVVRILKPKEKEPFIAEWESAGIPVFLEVQNG